ncbi:MAG: nuclear transport factor 2 family protein [Acidobacteriota bacterium]
MENSDRTSAETSATDELLRISDAILQAICAHDGETLARYLTSDFILMSGAARQDRESFLEGVGAADFTARDAGFEAIQVELMGETAIVGGIQRVEVEQGPDVIESRAAFTDVFILDGDRWLLRVAVSVELNA